MKIVMDKIEAEAFCEALSAYVKAIVMDATADAGDSQSGFAESNARDGFIAFLAGEVRSAQNRGHDETERAIIERALHTRRCSESADKALEDHFLPMVRRAIERGDLDEARAIARRIPSDSVASVFALDNIRQSEKSKAR